MNGLAEQGASGTGFDPDAFLERYPSGLSREEWFSLSRYAASCPPGAIVEVGSLRGRSACALAFGMLQRASGERLPIVCIEPHAVFTGVYGGHFGPKDRGAFYGLMLETGFYEHVALVNLKSADAARAWSGDIGLLFVDGDHTYAGVRADVEGWAPHVMADGVVAFDDAKDESVGPAPVIRELLQTGAFEHLEDVGKVVFLRKTAPFETPSRHAG